MKTQTQVSIGAAFAAIVLTLPSTADELSFVIPSEYEEMEGDDGNSPGWSYPTGYVWQAISDASLFADIPASHPIMTGFAWRPDGTLVTRPVTRTWNLTLRMGTIGIAADDIAQDFADNLRFVEGLTTVHDWWRRQHWQKGHDYQVHVYF